MRPRQDEEVLPLALFSRSSEDEAPLPLALVAGSGLLFALQAACLKLAVAHGVGALQFVEWRGAIQLLCVLGCLIVLRPLPVKHWLGVSWSQRRWLLLRALAGFCGIALSMAALERLPMGDSAALGFIQPAVSTLLAWLAMGEQIRRFDAVCILCSSAPMVLEPMQCSRALADREHVLSLSNSVLAVVGVVLISRPSFLFGGAVEQLDPVGIGFSLAAAVTAGCVVVLIRKLAKTLHFTVVLLYQAAGQVVICPMIMPLFGSQWVRPDPIALLALICGGLLGFCAQVMLTKGLSKARIGKASALRASSVVFAFLLQLIVTPNEPITLLSVLGATIITLSCATMLLHAGRHRTAGQFGVNHVPDMKVLDQSSTEIGASNIPDIKVLDQLSKEDRCWPATKPTMESAPMGSRPSAIAPIQLETSQTQITTSMAPT